jgi:DNA-binding response OmpR family regulator
MTKPFSMRELVARVHAVLRRVERAPADEEKHALRLGDIVIEVAARQVTRAGKVIHLTPIEFDLLMHLASKPDAVFTRDQLLSDIWGYRDTYGARTVDSHIGALRRKLGADLIRTVHGVGYALAPSEVIA